MNSQFQDGALGYSVAQGSESLSPHRIDLFRFQFPRFKVFQLVSYNNFVEGGWDLLKFPFFNGEGTWLGNAIPEGFSPDAQAFLRRAFAILHEHRDEFCSDDVEPLVPTLDARVFANRFTAGRKTALTLYNSGFATFRGEVVQVPHRPGCRYVDAFTGQPVPRACGQGIGLSFTGAGAAKRWLHCCRVRGHRLLGLRTHLNDVRSWWKTGLEELFIGPRKRASRTLPQVC